MCVKKLTLNPDKMEIQLVGPDLALISEHGLILMLGGVELTQKDFVRSLEVLLAPALLLDKQVAAVARNVFYLLWLICQH